MLNSLKPYLITLIAGALFTGATSATAAVKGQYVEARTASVFAGACHYNGEVVTTGREAVLAWQFESGMWNGVDLSNVRAVAVVSSEANLSDPAAKKTELVINSEATEAQADAVRQLLEEKSGTSLGNIVLVQRASIQFNHDDKGYAVKAGGITEIAVKPMADGECCKQPNLVWYTPLSPISDRKVGYTIKASYEGGAAGEPWLRQNENSAFYGRFEW